MLNYIISELQRLLSKKQTYVFYGIFMVAFTLILVLAESEQTAGGMAMMGGALLSISSMVLEPVYFTMWLVMIFNTKHYH